VEKAFLQALGHERLLWWTLEDSKVVMVAPMALPLPR